MILNHSTRLLEVYALKWVNLEMSRKKKGKEVYFIKLKWFIISIIMNL